MRRILIANRGEIALRILRACHEMGKEVVGAYSQVDESLLHLDYADDIICIGKSSYLVPGDLIVAAKNTGCDAIHPGYGFLSENADFAEMVTANNLIFIGPDAEHIRQLGDKALARELMTEHGLRPVPGSHGAVQDLSQAERIAGELGYPILLKASFGGGGRGIRLVNHRRDLQQIYAEVRSEANIGFGRDEIYIEKYLDNARHIEIQILGDGKGKIIHLGSRDCSVQRRHQKLVEEAPAPGISPEVVAEIAAASSRVLAALNYKNAATVEFLYQDEQFYFLEINTRLQVEHPVTEMITGIDIVKAQLSIAETSELPWNQEDINLIGCAIECRINAEDARYQPSPGIVKEYRTPGGPGIRLDSHIYRGYTVPHQYDSLIGKLVTHGVDRNEALARMNRALLEFRIDGIETSIAVLRQIINRPEFIQARFTTSLLEHK